MEKLEIDQQLRSIHNSNLTTTPAFPPRRIERYVSWNFSSYAVQGWFKLYGMARLMNDHPFLAHRKTKTEATAPNQKP